MEFDDTDFFRPPAYSEDQVEWLFDNYGDQAATEVLDLNYEMRTASAYGDLEDAQEWQDLMMDMYPDLPEEFTWYG